MSQQPIQIDVQVTQAAERIRQLESKSGVLAGETQALSQQVQQADAQLLQLGVQPGQNPDAVLESIKQGGLEKLQKLQEGIAQCDQALLNAGGQQGAV